MKFFVERQRWRQSPREKEKGVPKWHLISMRSAAINTLRNILSTPEILLLSTYWGFRIFFKDGNFRGRIQTSVLNTADVKRILNLNTKKERLTDFVLSTKDGIKLNLVSADPNGFDDVSSGEYDETHISFEVKSCSAKLSYKSFDLEHGENGTIFRDKLIAPDWYIILPHEYEMKDDRVHYNFWVVEV